MHMMCMVFTLTPPSPSPFFNKKYQLMNACVWVIIKPCPTASKFLGTALNMNVCHLSLTECLALTYWWSRELPVTMAMHETGHSTDTIVDWYNFHCDVCAQYFIDHPVQIGGAGKVVEIDESKFGRRKYNRGFERGSAKAFMVEVDNRSAATLLPIIQQHILPGTTVLFDEWRSYSCVPSLGMSHQTVNHSIHFVVPSTGAHTQGIESTWAATKRMMRKKGVMGTSNSLFPTYLQECVWRRKFEEEDTFNTILDHIAEQYPLP